MTQGTAPLLSKNSPEPAYEVPDRFGENRQFSICWWKLGVRYATLFLAMSANCLPSRPLATKTTDGRREVAPRYFVDEGGVLRFALIALLASICANC